MSSNIKITRFYGGDKAQKDELNAKKDYQTSLSDLKGNSKPLINTLSIVAGEYRKFGKTITETIENHLLKAIPAHKLPCLYLVDSIIKNIGAPYIEHMSKCVVRIFTNTFQEGDENCRRSLFKLRLTWKDIFTVDKLRDLDASVRDIDPNWPKITEAESAPSTVHINPNFLKKPAAPAPVQNIPADELSRAPELAKLELEKEKEEINRKYAELQEQKKQFERQKLQLQLQQQKQRLLEETNAAVSDNGPQLGTIVKGSPSTDPAVSPLKPPKRDKRKLDKAPKHEAEMVAPTAPTKPSKRTARKSVANAPSVAPQKISKVGRIPKISVDKKKEDKKRPRVSDSDGSETDKQHPKRVYPLRNRSISDEPADPKEGDSGSDMSMDSDHEGEGSSKGPVKEQRPKRPPASQVAEKPPIPVAAVFPQRPPPPSNYTHKAPGYPSPEHAASVLASPEKKFVRPPPPSQPVIPPPAIMQPVIPPRPRAPEIAVRPPPPVIPARPPAPVTRPPAPAPAPAGPTGPPTGPVRLDRDSAKAKIKINIPLRLPGEEEPAAPAPRQEAPPPREQRPDPAPRYHEPRDVMDRREERPFRPSPEAPPFRMSRSPERPLHDDDRRRDDRRDMRRGDDRRDEMDRRREYGPREDDRRRDLGPPRDDLDRRRGDLPPRDDFDRRDLPPRDDFDRRDLPPRDDFNRRGPRPHRDMDRRDYDMDRRRGGGRRRSPPRKYYGVRIDEVAAVPQNDLPEILMFNKDSPKHAPVPEPPHEPFTIDRKPKSGSVPPPPPPPGEDYPPMEEEEGPWDGPPRRGRGRGGFHGRDEMDGGYRGRGGFRGRGRFNNSWRGRGRPVGDVPPKPDDLPHRYLLKPDYGFGQLNRLFKVAEGDYMDGHIEAEEFAALRTDVLYMFPNFRLPRTNVPLPRGPPPPPGAGPGPRLPEFSGPRGPPPPRMIVPVRQRAPAPAKPMDPSLLFEQLLQTGLVQKSEPFKLSFNYIMNLNKDKLIDSLYTGTPCTNCGKRFDEDEVKHFNVHLDWHFSINIKIKNGNLPRKLYLTEEVWRQPSAPLTASNQQDGPKSDSTTNDGAGTWDDDFTGLKRCLLKPGDEEICQVCHDRLQQEYNQREDDWYFINAERREDDNKVCHVHCLQQTGENDEHNVTAALEATMNESVIDSMDGSRSRIESQDLETPTAPKLQTEISIDKEKEADLLAMLEKAKTVIVGNKAAAPVEKKEDKPQGESVTPVEAEPSPVVEDAPVSVPDTPALESEKAPVTTPAPEEDIFDAVFEEVSPRSPVRDIQKEVADAILALK